MTRPTIWTVRANGVGGFALVECMEPEDRPRLVYEDDYKALEAEITQLRTERDAFHEAEMAWEKLMMRLVGEDGLGSVEAAITQLRAERDLLLEGHWLIDGFARSIIEEPTNPNHVSMRAGNIRSWIRINTALTERHQDDDPFGPVTGEELDAARVQLRPKREGGQ